ncbi:hypothetical protein GCM10023084_53860 [Streptomyces lacrimifluminis]|uniref:Uncharacterized protein n=1 Tax=Streptomyces lacrimifluminis TaxID=1500077 RepID=A0A917KZN5_9ACTN|nr:hypothetical protein [Streptomyces lacrimifluminis]GGJ34442.1 hypothetical protein GCM10012282_34000 [Streptomyces lacrimifluminis]
MSGDLLASRVIPPHADDRAGRIVIGEYEAEELVPRLAISFESKQYVPKDNVQWVVSHPVLEDGSIRVVVFVVNYSAHDVTVNVYQDDQDR